MASEQHWDGLLNDHPVFALPKRISGPAGKGQPSLNLSLTSLRDFVDLDPGDDKPVPSGRRQAIAIKDADLIVAVGSEIRIASLADSKGGQATSQKSYKILHTPNVQFEIHQIALNPNGKLLAITGAFQVAVIVLPRTGFSKLVTATVDCKSIQVGQYHHAAETSAPVARIEWHPWGQGGSTLLVMTTDGKLREYDISEDADEPQQTLSFVPDRRGSTSFLAEDTTEREVASFAFGKGRADWGPLTVYAVMKSGDVYAMCPYMPKNASVPSSYVHALECYVAAKKEFLSASRNGDTSSDSLTTLYDYQHKYVSALMKQLPPGTSWPATTRLVPMHPPTTIRNPRLRQGPFLLQPSPRTLDGSEGSDATDIIYMSFSDDAAEESDGETERLGLVLVAFRDGQVDLYLDVEKVEARWESKQHPSNELPMLAVYESIDLGIVSTLSKATRGSASLLKLIQGNHPVFQPDPIHDDTLYVYHAFGVHALYLGSLLKSLAIILREGNDSEANSNSGLEASLDSVKSTDVQPVLLTFSVQEQCSTPVIGVAIPNDVYLTYSIFVLTSSMRMSVFPLTLRSDASFTTEVQPSISEKIPLALLPPPAPTPISKPTPIITTPKPMALPAPPDDLPAYISLLSAEPWTIPASIARPGGLPSNPRLCLPSAPDIANKELRLTPETLRYLGTTVEKLSSQIHDAELANRTIEARAALQEQEFRRQRETCARMLETIRALGTTRQDKTKERITRVKEQQKVLLARLDRVLQGLMAKASPELSESETKWFEELRRIKGEVVGAGKYDDQSLAARSKLLQREVERLLPHLKEMKEKEIARRKNAAENRESLGLSQAFELGKRSTEEQTRIGHLETEIVRLANKLDVTVGRPPSQRQQRQDETQNGKT